MTNFTGNYTSWNGLMQTANLATNGAYGAFLPFLVMVIAFAYTSRYGTSRAFAFSAFFGFISCLPLIALGITSVYVAVFIAVMALIGVFIMNR
jgi:heme A synthase